MGLILPILIVVVIGAIGPPLVSTVEVFSKILTDFIEKFWDLCQLLLRGVITWLRRAETPHPVKTFFGLLVLCGAACVLFADYHVALKTVESIFPWEIQARYLSFALVALTVCVGALAHLSIGYVKRASLGVTLVLLCLHGILAFTRQKEIERQGLLQTEQQIETGSGLLIFNDTAQVVHPPETDPIPRAVIGPSDDDRMSSSAPLAAATAVLLSAASVLTVWGGVALLGDAVGWIFGGAGLVALALSTSPIYFMKLLVSEGRLTSLLVAVSETILAVCRLPSRALAWLHPAAFRRRHWIQRQQLHDLHMKQMERDYEVNLWQGLLEKLRAPHEVKMMEIFQEHLEFLHRMCRSILSETEARINQELEEDKFCSTKLLELTHQRCSDLVVGYQGKQH